MNLPVLAIKNLSVSFATGAVSNISLSIAPGEILAIVGESGSGKSVTALAIMQLLSKKATVNGQILFSTRNAQVDLLSMPEEKINAIRGKDIAMIFQEPMTSLNPVLSCGEQVTEVIELHQKLSKKNCKATNDRVI